MIVAGSIEALPMGSPQPTIDPMMRIVLIVLGILIFLLGAVLSAVLVWRERPSYKPSSVQISRDDIQAVANEVVAQIKSEDLDQTKPMPHMLSLFEERKSHFREEKHHLADHFVPHFLRRCRALIENGQRVYLLIDSGTTLYPFFERIGRATVRAHENQEWWIDKLYIETNNLPGVEMLMRVGLINPNNRYSPLAISCNVLPGTLLPVYSALTGKRTNAALQRLRNGAGSNTVFIALTTGNWVRLRRSTPVCPVPLARGIGHLEFKQALIDNSDEIYVVAPLGKTFIDIPPGVINKALGFDERHPDPAKKPYHEVNISDEKAAYVKMVSTHRELGRVLSEHSTRVRTLLGVDDIELNSILERFHDTQIVELSHILFPFEKLPNDWYQQIEIEFPHSHTRRDEFTQKFFFVPPPPRK